MYASFFNLRELPFQLTPDPRFFFANPAAEAAYTNLVYGIQQRKGFIVVTGEVGTGKTTLLRRLIDNVMPDTPYVLIFNPRLDFDEMLTFSCDELGIRPAGPQRVRKFQALNRFFLAQLRRGGTTALIVDEAQDLTHDVLEDLRLLSNLETSGEKLLQIVLVGQPELDEKLQLPKLRQLRQRISVYGRLDCLRPREVEGFIRHRLEVAGATAGFCPFTPEAMVSIVRASHGVPRLINQICDGALLACYASSLRTVTRDVVDEVVADLRLGEEQTVPGAAVFELDRALGRVGETAKQLEATGSLPVRREPAAPRPTPSPRRRKVLRRETPGERVLLGSFFGSGSTTPPARFPDAARATQDASGPKPASAGSGAFFLVLLLLGIAALIAVRTGAAPSIEWTAEADPSAPAAVSAEAPARAGDRGDTVPPAARTNAERHRTSRNASGGRRSGGQPAGLVGNLAGYGRLGPSRLDDSRQCLTRRLTGEPSWGRPGQTVP